MPEKSYFNLGTHSFEKNSGYKNTVYALAELIDNSVEANATRVVVGLMVNRHSKLQNISVIDNGDGMAPDLIQDAVCEKSGTNLDRQSGASGETRRKYGKYGVGLPKASISQCNVFTVWSSTSGGFSQSYRNGVDILDEEWIIKNEAKVAESTKEAAPAKWISTLGFSNENSGTMVLWSSLDGLTWARARWGQHSGLIPNLEFQVGRTYRKLTAGPKPELEIRVIVIKENFQVIEDLIIEPNDPLYITPGCKVPRETLADGTKWPKEDPLFDDLTGKDNNMDVVLPVNGEEKTFRVSWKRSAAFGNVFASYNGRQAGNLKHGKHAAKNVGLSLLREGREVELSQALAIPSEPRERWFGVEFNFPHELDKVLGMTTQKQGYTKLDQVLTQPQEDFLEDGETSSQCIIRIYQEDPELARCLEIAWKIQKVWHQTKGIHKNMREDFLGESTGETGEGAIADGASPADAAETIATTADLSDGGPAEEPTVEEKEDTRDAVVKELTSAGVPVTEAKQIANRIVDRGLRYVIANRPGLGSPFFNVGKAVDAKIIELNEDHGVYPLLLSTVKYDETEDIQKLKSRLHDAKIAVFLMLEAWAKVESEAVKDEKRRLQRFREDWGRSLDEFVSMMSQDSQ